MAGIRLISISESGAVEREPPVPIDDATRASDALRMLREGRALLWTGDFRNGRHLLAALRRRVDRQRRDHLPDDLAARWRAHRAATRERGRLLGGIQVVLEPDGTVDLRRAPDTREAVAWAWGLATERRLVALTTLLGALSAAEWTRKGLEVPGLEGRITPRFGVFSPTRSAYVELLRDLDVADRSVMDVGCGTGVLAFVLLQRGASRAVGTDIEPRAVACALDNAERLGLAERFRAIEADLFAPGERVDLVVFNAPWVPEVPSTRLDRAVFDPGGQILRRFLAGAAAHLTPTGRVALLISDLPERLGLRDSGEIEGLASAAGLTVVDTAEVAATHRRSRDPDDPLHQARAAERIRRLVLSPVSS